MPEESLLTPEVRALVGAASEPVTVEVTAQLARRAIEVYGGEPRSFAPGDRVPGPVVTALQGEANDLAVPSLMPRSILVSNDLSFERPLRVGEVLAVRRRIADISERLGGRFGYAIYVRSEVEFHDGEGALVATVGHTLMQYEHEAAEGEE